MILSPKGEWLIFAVLVNKEIDIFLFLVVTSGDLLITTVNKGKLVRGKIVYR